MHASGSLAAVLLDRAHDRPAATAYEFLAPDGSVSALTCAELAGRAAAVAARLDTRAPVLLVQPPGPDFVVALWGCLLAGAPVVPAYPPTPVAGDRAGERLRRILADARPEVVIAPAGLLGDTGAARLVEVTAERAGPWEGPLPSAGDVAVVQYTSGSTSEPKGVVLRHDNLLHNTRAIAEVFALEPGAPAVSWLPPYHDMGLIGGILTPVLVGLPMRLFSPLHFLKSPLTWLRQISETGATASGGPNFAYDLCVRRATRDEELAGLDLSRWRVAFNGAEPVRRETLERFTERFAPHGFRAEAFLPCYGLAEATLIVTGAHWRPGGRGRVSCGPVVRGHGLAVVDPETGARLPEGVEGEVVVSGPSVTSGYWNGDDTGLFLDVAGVRHLRTGDLGYLVDGELVVSGRRHDVLVHRGVNHHAVDVEAAAVGEEFRPAAAAFVVDREGAEPSPVVVLERAGEVPPELVDRVRSRVLAATGLRLDSVVVVPPRTIPRTTSGKVRRSRCRELLLAGELAGAREFGEPVARVAPDTVTEFVCSVFAAVCEREACDPDAALVDLGGDSVRAAEIAAVVEGAAGVAVGPEDVLEAGTPRLLAQRVVAAARAAGLADDAVAARLVALAREREVAR